MALGTLRFFVKDGDRKKMTAGRQSFLAPFKRQVALGGILVNTRDWLSVHAKLGDARIVEAIPDPADAPPIESERDRRSGPVVIAKCLRLVPSGTRELSRSVRETGRVEIERVRLSLLEHVKRPHEQVAVAPDMVAKRLSF